MLANFYGALNKIESKRSVKMNTSLKQGFLTNSVFAFLCLLSSADIATLGVFLCSKYKNRCTAHCVVFQSTSVRFKYTF